MTQVPKREFPCIGILEPQPRIRQWNCRAGTARKCGSGNRVLQLEMQGSDSCKKNVFTKKYVFVVPESSLIKLNLDVPTRIVLSLLT